MSSTPPPIQATAKITWTVLKTAYQWFGNAFVENAKIAETTTTTASSA